VPNAWGKSKHNLFKNAKGRLYYFLICPSFIFSSPTRPEAVNLSAWEIVVSKVSAVLFENQIVLTLWLATLSACAVGGFEIRHRLIHLHFVG
jgi:hypothetical protein